MVDMKTRLDKLLHYWQIMINTNKITMFCGEIDDTNNLKFLPFIECQLEPGNSIIKLNIQKKKLMNFKIVFYINIYNKIYQNV